MREDRCPSVFDSGTVPDFDRTVGQDGHVERRRTRGNELPRVGRLQHELLELCHGLVLLSPGDVEPRLGLVDQRNRVGTLLRLVEGGGVGRIRTSTSDRLLDEGVALGRHGGSELAPTHVERVGVCRNRLALIVETDLRCERVAPEQHDDHREQQSQDECDRDTDHELDRLAEHDEQDDQTEHECHDRDHPEDRPGEQAQRDERDEDRQGDEERAASPHPVGQDDVAVRLRTVRADVVDDGEGRHDDDPDAGADEQQPPAVEPEGPHDVGQPAALQQVVDPIHDDSPPSEGIETTVQGAELPLVPVTV